MDEMATTFDYYGCSLPALPKDSIAVGMNLQIKVMDAEGHIGYHEFSSGLSSMESLGMLDSAADTVRFNIMRGMRKP